MSIAGLLIAATRSSAAMLMLIRRTRSADVSSAVGERLARRLFRAGRDARHVRAGRPRSVTARPRSVSSRPTERTRRIHAEVPRDLQFPVSRCVSDSERRGHPGLARSVVPFAAIIQYEHKAMLGAHATPLHYV